ncbi:hypothetical protein GGI12_001826 [Dipsacomyces acuminosporus]|nr:hypothetical protein GGI12_001826 [Dipsacomyces acuminosporus]
MGKISRFGLFNKNTVAQSLQQRYSQPPANHNADSAGLGVQQRPDEFGFASRWPQDTAVKREPELPTSTPAQTAQRFPSHSIVHGIGDGDQGPGSLLSAADRGTKRPRLSDTVSAAQHERSPPGAVRALAAEPKGSLFQEPKPTNAPAVVAQQTNGSPTDHQPVAKDVASAAAGSKYNKIAIQSKLQATNKRTRRQALDAETSESEYEEPFSPGSAIPTRASGKGIADSEDSETEEEEIKKAYAKHRALYLKYTRWAQKAEQDMHRVAEKLFSLIGTKSQGRVAGGTADTSGKREIVESRGSVPVSAGAYSPELGADDYKSDAPSDYSLDLMDEYVIHHRSDNNEDSPKEEQGEEQGEGQGEGQAGLQEATIDSGRIGFHQHNDGYVVASTAEQSTPELRSVDRATRPYQFRTYSANEFRRKPRAAFTCSFEGIDSQTIVAYGLDGTLQFWDPVTQRLDLSLDKNELNMEYAEHVAQISPSLLAAVPAKRGSSEGGGRYAGGNSAAPAVVFINKTPSSRRSSLQVGPVQPWAYSPHEGPISVVEGMPECMHRRQSRAFMLSGGVKDKKVYLWSVDTARSEVAKAEVARQMRGFHTSRITALCYEPNRDFVLSGSESGRISINDAECGKLIMETEKHALRSVIGSLVVSPKNSNIVMASCAAISGQLRFFDLRQNMKSIKPSLVLGTQTASTQSRYIRPAWHPEGCLVVCPVHKSIQLSSEEGAVAIWDTRYSKCAMEAPQIYRPHKGPVWSVDFADHSATGMSMMVTTGGDHNIAFTSFRV